MKALPATHTLLFVTRTSPFPGDSGSGAYVYDLLSYLKKAGFQIHVIWTEPPDLNPSRGWYTPPPSAPFTLQIPDTLRIGRRFWRASIVWLPFKARVFHVVKSVLTTLHLWPKRPQPAHSPSASAPASVVASPSWDSSASPAEIAFVQAAISAHRPDVVVANYAWMSPSIRPATASSAARTVPYAVLTHDVRHRQLHLREGVLTEVLNEHTSLEQELAQLQAADALIAIQSVEASVFARHFPAKSIITAPMSAALRPLPTPDAPIALFVGSSHGPNLTGLRWFLSQVWPQLQRELPFARLLIAGSICSALTEELPAGVEKLGRLPDLSTAYARASVVIAPILQGSGIKIKILEAFSFGRCCVTTSVGAEGLATFLPHIRIADTADAFTRDTLALLSNPALTQETARTLQSLTLTHLSPESCYGPVVSLLHLLAAQNSAANRHP